METTERRGQVGVFRLKIIPKGPKIDGFDNDYLLQLKASASFVEEVCLWLDATVIGVVK